MDSSKFKRRVQRRLYHYGGGDVASLTTASLPLTEASMEYFQDSFPGTEGLGRLDMPMAATVTKRNRVSPCSMVLSMLYAKRLRQRSKDYLQTMSSTDVFFISMMMASKYMYDEGIDEEVYNDEWAASIGQEVDDVNQMEMDFLKEMDWQLFVKPEEFDQALTAVERRLALKEGVKRGWFTYTEMALLLDWEPVHAMWTQVGLDCTKVISLFSTVYVASLVSMMGSAAIALQLSSPLATATVAVLSLHTFPHSSTGNTPITIHSSCCDSSQSRFTHGSNDYNVVAEQNNTHHLQVEDVSMELSNDSGNAETMKRKTISVGDIPAPLQYVYDGDTATFKTSRDGDGISFPTTVKPASMLSFWLFDSLLSQVWPLFGHRLNHNSTVSAGNVHSGQLMPTDKSKCLYDTINCETCRKRSLVKKFNGTCRRCKLGSQSHKSFESGSYQSPGHLSTTVKTGMRVENLDPPIAGSRQVLRNDLSTHQSASSRMSTHLDCNKLESCNSLLQCSTSFNGNPSSRDIDNDSSLPHHRKVPTTNSMKANTDLVSPMSLMADVPLLDPVGFFTKNAGPAFVLGT